MLEDRRACHCRRQMAMVIMDDDAWLPSGFSTLFARAPGPAMLLIDLV